MNCNMIDRDSEACPVPRAFAPKTDLSRFS